MTNNFTTVELAEFTPAQLATLAALRAFALSGSYTDPYIRDSRIMVAQQGWAGRCYVTTDGRPFEDAECALDHETAISGE